MSEDTKIEWTDYTWNPWEGCTKVSPGCLHCYAETRNHRFGGDNWGRGKPRRKTVDWKKPVRWNRQPWICDDCGTPHAVPGAICMKDGCDCETKHRARVFPSLCDVWDEEVLIEWLADLCELIFRTPNLDWLLLSKRPELAYNRMHTAMDKCFMGARPMMIDWLDGKPPENVWLGTSVEDQQRADERIPALLKIPAKVRFLSAEPLLGPVDLWGARYDNPNGGKTGAVSSWKPSVDWVIAGGESGPGARPCSIKWIRDVVQECKAAEVPCFVKQLGSFPVEPEWNPKLGSHRRIELNHPKGGEPAEWSEDLRVREFPKVDSGGRSGRGGLCDGELFQ